MSNALDKISKFFLENLPAIIFLSIPLFFLTNTFDYFAFNKFFLLNVLASLSLIAWSVQSILKNKINLTTSTPLKLLFILALAHFGSAIFMSPTKVLSLTGITTLFTSLFIIHLTYTSNKPNIESLKKQAFALYFSISIISLLTILHFFGLSKYLLGSELTQSAYFNISGGILPALTLTLPLLLGTLVYLYHETNLKTKIILFCFFGLATSATIINTSLLLPKNGVSPVTVLPLGSSWSISLDIFKYLGTAFLGTGPENYLATFTRLRPNNLNNTVYWNTRFSESGSFILTLLTTSGLIGGISFLLLFLKSISQSLKIFSEAHDKPFLALLISTLVISLVVFSVTPTGIVTIIIYLLLISLLTQYLKKQGHKSINELHFNISTEGSQNKVLSYFLPITTLVISLTVIITYWTFGSRFYKASIALKEANNLINTDLAGSFLKQQEAQRLNPYDPTYSIVLSKNYNQIALFYLLKENQTAQDKKNAVETMQRAIDAGRQAAKVDPFNVLVWENLANIYQSFIGAAEGSENLAISHLARAISLDPSNAKLRLQLGILYYNLKDSEQAIKLINQALDLKPNWDIPYINLYRIYSESGDYLKAQSYLKQGVNFINPNSEDYEKYQEELVNLTEKINKK